MSKISEFSTVSSPALTALIPIVELPVTQGNPSVNKKISLSDLKTRLSNVGNFTFSANDASLPLGNDMTLSTYQNGGNKESRLTLSTSGISSLDVGNNLRVRVGYGTGFEQTWTYGADGSLRFPDNSLQTTAFTGSTGSSVTVITPDDTEIEGITTLVFTGAGVTASSAGNAVTLDISGATANTGDLTFLENELRNPTYASIKLATDAVGGSRRVFTFYADGALELPTSNLGVGTMQSSAGIWLNASGVLWKFNSNGAVDFPSVNDTTSLIRSADSTTINSNGKEWLFNETGTLTVPGIIIHPTVDISNYSSIVSGITLTPETNVIWSDGSYPFTFNGGSGSVIVSSGFAGIVDLIPGTIGWSVGDTLATIDGATLGGTTGIDDLILTVESIIPTSIDLTKTVNKLGHGNYFLGDGAEGQIMYLVTHPAVTVPADINISVYASRDNSAAYTYRTLVPFTEGKGTCTLLFTSGSWQSLSNTTFI